VAGTAVAAWIFLGEHISLQGALGIFSVCLGIALLGLRQWRHPGSSRSYYLALVVGLTSTSYSIVDKLGVGLLNPVVYLAGLGFCCALFLTPFVLLVHRQECRKAWQDYKMASLWVGIGSIGTYLLILVAYQHAEACYVVAVREFSIAVVATLGVAVLKEPLTLPKALSTVAIVVGVILVKLA
jgi:drug/metabolite transporter (DMT)-like permease